MDCRELLHTAEIIIQTEFQKPLEKANAHELHFGIAQSLMQTISPKWQKSRENHAERRRAYYFSAEYLMGRQIYNNLFSAGILGQVSELLAERGMEISALEEIGDMALGNGGLGRLAACFLDSAATHDLPLDGYGLRYRYGLFSQRIEDGFQREYADNWERFRDPWSKVRDDERIPVIMSGEIYTAVPYDMPVIGYRSDNYGTLRLFSCEAERGFDLSRFNAGEYFLASHAKNAAEIITAVLYPNDDTWDGKRLRFMQQYLLSSAGMQDILRRYKRKSRAIADFPAHCAIQLNDTHPTLAIPELIRLLMSEGMDFSQALESARLTFSYTNHTVMSEALEKWDRRLICSVVPEIYDIICRIDAAARKVTCASAFSDSLSIVQDDTVHMANLASFVSCHINGVSQIHTDILCNSLLKGWHELFPGKFSNKTNGITQRRFLGVANPLLTSFIKEKLGTDAFLTDLALLSGLHNHLDDVSVSAFAEIKRKNKLRLSARIYRDTGIPISPDFLFDVQIKRLHEYKRQLMNAFSIYNLYLELKSGALTGFHPTCFIFGAKAASSYRRAKGIIKYINELAKLVNSDPDMHDLLKVVFVPDYNCSYAEMIIPAADISEQISPVGTEASGTGNMKLMLNGAVTLGTNDGANIEIADAAGYENNYIFCMNAHSPSEAPSPNELITNDRRIEKAVFSLTDGTLSDGGTGVFREIYDSLLHGPHPDPYYVLRDLSEYTDTKLRAISDYNDPIGFYRKGMINTASAGRFSSDRTVAEYARDIWHIY